MSVRVRFAPSPTGPLHIGGVRTALYNYLFARKHNGQFILRIEDTDQKRFVDGAEKYIQQALDWCGISPDESPWAGGPHVPYRQSERSELYKQYAEELYRSGHAYYAFDTPEELEQMRQQHTTAENPSPTYNHQLRQHMRNSLTLSEAVVNELLQKGEPAVLRFKMSENQEVVVNDTIRGEVNVNTGTLDDKVLMKSDGLPTYHLANVVDDHLMQISHVIRGEEWLPSAPLHVLLYQAFGWEPPQFAHLPLLLKPDGKGKLSKRDGDKLGFPVFPLNWQPAEGEAAAGYREQGFLPEAFINFLALLGWSSGTEREMYSLTELTEAFSLEQVGKSGTKFNFDKAKWFNEQYLRQLPESKLAEELQQQQPAIDSQKALRIAGQLRERITFLHELGEKAIIYMQAPDSFNEKLLRKKWKPEIAEALAAFAAQAENAQDWSAEEAKALFEQVLAKREVKLGQAMQPLRLALTGEAGGPDLMELLSIIGPAETANRIRSSSSKIEQMVEG
jgi:glutamyl-tRNA synthetase